MWELNGTPPAYRFTESLFPTLDWRQQGVALIENWPVGSRIATATWRQHSRQQFRQFLHSSPQFSWFHRRESQDDAISWRPPIRIPAQRRHFHIALGGLCGRRFGG